MPAFRRHFTPCPRSRTRPSGVLDLGAVASTKLPDRLAMLPSAVRRVRSLTHRHSKYTRSRKCAECPDLAECGICPAAICHCEDDPDLVPDHQCAFERITLATRRRLPGRINADRPALGSRRRARLLEELKRELEAGLGHS